MAKLNWKQKVILIFLLTAPLVDLVTSLSTRFLQTSITLGVITKGLSFGAAMIYTLFFSRTKYKKISLIYIGSICLFAGIYFLTKPEIWSISNIVSEVIYAFKYLYFPLMLVCFHAVFTELEIRPAMIKKVLTINCFVYAVLLLIPYFTGTGFPSYHRNFGGNTGWFYAANEIGAILVVLSVTIAELMDNDHKPRLLLALPILFALSIIGTKVSLLGSIVIVLTVIVCFVIKTKKNRFLLPVCLLLILAVCCVGSAAVVNIQVLNEAYGEYVEPTDPIPSTTVPETTEPEITVPEESTAPNVNQSISQQIQSEPFLRLLNTVLSSRVNYFLQNYHVYAKSGPLNVLFGLSWSDRASLNYTNASLKKLVEIDFIDILFHYGVVGCILYFAPLAYLAWKFFRNIRHVKVESYPYLISAVLGLGISMLAGHVLGAPSVSIYLILLILVVVGQTHPKD